MKPITRRELHRLALGGAAGFSLHEGLLRGAGKPDSRIKGVQIGVQSYSFRDRPLDAAIQAMVEIGLSSCELYQGHVEPRSSGRGPEAREALRKWRTSVSLDEFKAVRRKFDAAGIDLYAYNLSFRDDFTDEEMDRGFEMARALGVKIITASSTVSAAKRIDGFAKRHKIKVGMHGHDNVKDPNEYSSPESFARAMEGASEYIAINLDIGHFTAAGFDAVDYLAKHHDRIVTLHVKDRKKNTPDKRGDNLPFGEGETPIKAVLAMLRDKKWKIPANIEYEYRGADAVVEVRKCLEYCRTVLTA